MSGRSTRRVRFEGARGWTPGLTSLLCLALLVGVVPARAQEGGEEVPEYRREVFNYPAEGRRDPFRPVRDLDSVGPRFEDLALSGILFNPRMGSIAVVVDENMNKRYRVREGERLGQVRVVEIRRTEVVFAVSGFGRDRQEVLRLVKREEDSEG